VIERDKDHGAGILQQVSIRQATTSSRRWRQNLVANGINAAKLFQLFVKKGVVTIIAIINNAIDNRTSIMMELRISVYQSLKFFNL